MRDAPEPAEESPLVAESPSGVSIEKPSFEPKTPVRPKPSAKVEADFAQALNSSEGTATDDLKILKGLFFQLRTITKENPVGSHEEIVASLTGDNPANIAYIPLGHRALRGGKLYDRWGEPYYFHQISGREMEIRSAGPDGVHWSEDDVVIR